jgi:hypothetical protein
MKTNHTLGNVLVYRFKVAKHNKQDTIYIGLETNPKESFITELVKIERFQGYSNAYNLGLYFRIRNTTNWAKCRQVTGMFKTMRSNVFYGDNKANNSKSLLLFCIEEITENLTVYEYPQGFYPSRSIIDELVKEI